MHDDDQELLEVFVQTTERIRAYDELKGIEDRLQSKSEERKLVHLILQQLDKTDKKRSIFPKFIRKKEDSLNDRKTEELELFKQYEQLVEEEQNLVKSLDKQSRIFQTLKNQESVLLSLVKKKIHRLVHNEQFNRQLRIFDLKLARYKRTSGQLAPLKTKVDDILQIVNEIAKQFEVIREVETAEYTYYGVGYHASFMKKKFIKENTARLEEVEAMMNKLYSDLDTFQVNYHRKFYLHHVRVFLDKYIDWNLVMGFGMTPLSKAIRSLINLSQYLRNLRFQISNTAKPFSVIDSMMEKDRIYYVVHYGIDS